MRNPVPLAIAAALVLSTAGGTGLTLIQDRLTVDALFWGNAMLRWDVKEGWLDPELHFRRQAFFVGATGRIDEATTLRAYLDLGNAVGVPAYDLYASFRWPAGVSLTVGQFLVPLGFEALTPYPELKFIEFSAVQRFVKPADPRDIGAMVSYDHSAFDLAVAVVNGPGRNIFWDENRWKDVAARVVLEPLSGVGLLLAVRGYYGRLGKDQDLEFRNAAVEIRYRSGDLELAGEGQFAKREYKAAEGTPIPLGRNSFYVHGAHDFGMLQPVLRCDVEFQADDKFDIAVTGGMNFLVLGDRLKVMVQYEYWRKESIDVEKKSTLTSLMVQLQGAI